MVEIKIPKKVEDVYNKTVSYCKEDPKRFKRILGFIVLLILMNFWSNTLTHADILQCDQGTYRVPGYIQDRTNVNLDYIEIEDYKISSDGWICKINVYAEPQANERYGKKVYSDSISEHGIKTRKSRGYSSTEIVQQATIYN